MSGYADLQQEAWEALETRRYRRRRIVSGIRGRLRESQRSRHVAMWLFLASMVPGAAVAVLARICRVDGWGVAPALGFLVQWPVFVLLTGWQCERWTRRNDVVRKVEEAIPLDEATEARENAGLYSEADSGIRQAIENGLRSGTQQGGGGLPGLLVLGCLTLGTLLVWDLIRIAPTLFAETILDGPVARRDPSLAGRLELENWRQNAFGSTAVHFLGLALVSVVTGSILVCLRQVR